MTFLIAVIQQLHVIIRDYTYEVYTAMWEEYSYRSTKKKLKIVCKQRLHPVKIETIMK